MDLKCPKCECERISTLERLTGYARIQYIEDGKLYWAGGTEVDWNSDSQVLNQAGDFILICDNCSEQFTIPGLKIGA